ncbi:uncharacterized protein LOC113372869 [Ctenocephalides felis]|uniref:uncharacterized protein LOC113372869 n=1 Tax=Ctenocephalides felis TaxID=7515 RepID=UPI000E6E377B|nr:uncharacterized protein LOC113372869 [Ctenocephalides felis]
MDRNIEIKAKLPNKTEVISKLKSITSTQGELIPQHDIFYKVPNGRLKLRIFPDETSTLVHYNRPDISGPKLSEYTKFNIEGQNCKQQTEALKAILSSSLGLIGEVKKTRLLFLIGQTRVHIDAVEGLGDFVELEVVLNETQSVKDGEGIADEIMLQLGIKESDLLTHAYFDMIQDRDK